MKKVSIFIYFLFFINLSFADVGCIDGIDGCLFGWNEVGDDDLNWTDWTYFDPINEYGTKGFMMNEDNSVWSGSTFNWANPFVSIPPNWVNSGRIRIMSKGADTLGDILGKIGTNQRSPSTTQGNSFKVYDSGLSSDYAASWWMWYDGIPLSERNITNSQTNRMSFYIKTEGMTPLSTPTKIEVWGYHVGTYLCWDGLCPKEGPGNQHYYHYLAINPGAWIHVELDQHPQHRREGSGPVAGNNPSFILSGKNYFEQMMRFYMEIRKHQTQVTSMFLDEIKFYSTLDSDEPNQNEDSITSVWVGYWGNEDYWEIGFSDNSFNNNSGYYENSFSTFEIKWSTQPISNINYDSAILIEPMFYSGNEYTDGRVGAIRRGSSYGVGVWTRFELPNSVEVEGDKIYFAIKDISIGGTGGGSKYPWNRLDGHDAPTQNIRTIDYSIGELTVDPLVIVTEKLSDGKINTFYSKQLFATGGVSPLTYTNLSQLTPGLTISSEGLISGTILESGAFNLNFEIQDSNSSANILPFNFNLNVNPVELCIDSIDNDGDGLVDCLDSECFSKNFCSITIVDFGNPHIFGLDNWTNIIKDTYTDYVELEDGMSTIVGSNKDYNSQGVLGTSSILFQENDSIKVIWYNGDTLSKTFTPRISFIDSGRPDNLWYLMDEITVLPDQTKFSSFTFNSTTFGNYDLVNVNVNYENNQILFTRSINLFSNSNTSDSEDDICIEDWNCTEWSICSNGNQTQSCNDIKSCGTVLNKPSEIRSCTILNDTNSSCISSWSCGYWNTCSENLQNRSCLGLNSCSVNKSEYRSCSIPIVVQPPGGGGSSPSGGLDGGSISSGEGKSFDKKKTSKIFIRDILNDNKELENVCIPSFKFLNLAKCENGLKTQIRTDLNGCVSKKEITLKCNTSVYTLDNLRLNYKETKLIKLDNLNKYYLVDFSNKYYQGLILENMPAENEFIVLDESSGEEYFAVYDEKIGDKYYVSLLEIDENSIENTLVERIIEGELSSEKETSKIWMVRLGTIIFVWILIFAAYYVRKLHKKNDSQFQRVYKK
jgi:hypothetical protein